MKIGDETSIYTFTDSFKEKAVDAILEDPRRMIAIDGGPHTLWWPTQGNYYYCFMCMCMYVCMYYYHHLLVYINSYIILPLM